MTVTDLFSLAPAPKPVAAPRAALVGKGIQLRYCQREDVDAITHALESGYRKPCCVAATGYGKGAMIAELAGRTRANGKVLCLLDRAHLVHQLADEIERHLGVRVGRVADGACDGITRDIVCATVQAMFTPDRKGVPMYEYPTFDGVRTVIPDEAHKFFADCFGNVLHHFYEMNGASVIGFTATPVAANGARWQSFFDWTPEIEGPCMRTVGWCVRNGYLVPPRQAFIKVNLDLASIYASLKTSEDGDAEEDGGDASAVLLDLLRDKGERDAAAFAAGVVEVIGVRRALVFTPPRKPSSDTAPCKLLAAWLQAAGMSCQAVWGGRADVSEVLGSFRRRSEPQALANVNLLCEGYNAPGVSAVFICRLLKQWRLIQQMVGRALRPHGSAIPALNVYDTPDGASARRAAIAASEKPDAIIADLVGLDGKVLQASAVDVMYADAPAEVRREMGEIIARSRTGRPEEDRPADDLLEAARSALLTKQHEQAAELARRRGMAGGIAAEVSVTYGDGEPHAPVPNLPVAVEVATEKERARFVALAVGLHKAGGKGGYDATRARDIAERFPRNKLRGMSAGLDRKLKDFNAQPAWNDGRRAYPNAWTKGAK